MYQEIGKRNVIGVHDSMHKPLGINGLLIHRAHTNLPLFSNFGPIGWAYELER